MEKSIGGVIVTTITREILIDAPIKEVYDAYADPENWKYVLSDVLDVNTIYDDGRNQEFNMTVERNFKPETVRSIRYCTPYKKIELFQPVPPPQVETMSGTWEFIDVENQTKVVASRQFDLKENSCSSEKLKKNQKLYERKLFYYLGQNLDYFKAFSENRGKIKVATFVPVGKEELIKCFWDIKNWYSIWAPIEGVQVLHDDGINQTFSMKVWRNEVCEDVTTIRRLNGGVIDFTSPVPPPKLSEHSGKWEFTEVDNGTIVTAIRDFKMDPSQLEKDLKSSLIEYKLNLQKRVSKILGCFAEHYDKKR
ncbi:SRPBCC family protein [Bacillus wiedmannii]|uniref:SRPBCC family protein n=1 Tax=Bacillus wiedmannii TaxID=1890302 RepID=UPI0015D50B89|nr:SRPBCC family protein [Bacillus wiedmannii]